MFLVIGILLFIALILACMEVGQQKASLPSLIDLIIVIVLLAQLLGR